MDEITIDHEQQLAEPKVKLDSLQADSPQQARDSNPLPLDLTETPEFKSWSETEIKKFMAAHKYAWRADIPREKLFMKDDGSGYPDPVLQQKAHKFVSANHKFRGSDGEVLVNPATGRLMSFMIWQSILPDPVLPTE